MAGFRDFLEGMTRAYGIPFNRIGQGSAPRSDSGGLAGQGSGATPTPQLGPYQSGPSPYSSEGISNMLDLKKLGLLFDKAKTDPGAARTLRGLGPGITEAAGPPTEDIKGGPFALPEAHRVGPQAPLESTGDKFDLSGFDQPKQGRDWGSILSKISIGAQDMGNALASRGNANEGGAIYELNKQKFQQEQIQKLRTRQGMWEESYKVSQSLPAEVLTDPRFAALAQAKQALDKDLADGQIDNEKNVSNFNLEYSRAKHSLNAIDLERADQEKIASAQRMGTAQVGIDLGRRQELERLAGDPTNPQSGAAAQELQRLKLSDITRRNVGGQEVSMTGDNWAKYDIERPDKEREYGLREKAINMSALDRSEGRADREAGRRGTFLNQALNAAITRRMPGDKAEWTPELAAQAEAEAMKEMAPRMLAMAQAAGIQVDDSRIPIRVGNQSFQTEDEAMRYLLSILS